MVFEGLQIGGSEENPAKILKDLITIDDDIDLKTNLKIDGIKSLIHLHTLNYMRSHREEGGFSVLEGVLNSRYKSYMASEEGWRSNQVIDGLKQFIQQVLSAGNNAIEQMGGKKQ